MKQKLLLYFTVLFFSISTIFSIDNAHFYKAPLFHGIQNYEEEKDWLTQVNLIYANGSTHRGLNSRDEKTQAFDIYGHHNLLSIFSGVANPTNMPLDVLAIHDNTETKRIAFNGLTDTQKGIKTDFGQGIFSGKFETDEVIIDINQNIKNNFFVQLNIPFRRVNVSKIDFIDTSTDATNPPAADNYTKTDATWTDFLTSFSSGDILNAYGLENYSEGYKRFGFGDININVGWRKEWLDPIDFLEFVKIIPRLGVQFPTNINALSGHPFSIPAGYNGHFGFPVRFDAIAGLSKDIFLGAHTGLTLFCNKTHKHFRVKTDINQNGFIKLAQCKVTEKKGLLFDFGIYLKLDHFFKGLSALTGYSYNKQARDHLVLVNAGDHSTNTTIIDSDSTLQGWSMHTTHFMIDYNLGVHNFFSKRKWQPQFGFFYNYPFTGKGIFVTPMTGSNIGCNVTWKF